MKPFDSFEPVQRRDGRKARIIGRNAEGRFPITALVKMLDGSEQAESFTLEGAASYYAGSVWSDGDLINVPPETRKVKLWLAVAQNDLISVYMAREPHLHEGWKAIKEFDLEIVVP